MNKKISNYVWCIVNGNYLPQVGNGKQWQHPVFPTKKDATEFMKEAHGLDGYTIEKCEIKIL